MSALPISTQSIETLTSLASFSWWIYILIVLLFFFGGLILNYIVKKINEARLENRFENLTNKAAANQATQILRPIAEPDKSVLPTNNGISLVFNKEDNLLEDKRRKEEPNKKAPVNEQVNVTITSTDNLGQNSESGREDEITEYVFLGSIYKELFENRLRIQKSRSLSSAITHRDSIISDIFNKMVWKKITESKSTPSIKKFCSMDSEEYLRDWIFDLVRNKGPDVPDQNHLATPINKLIHSESTDQNANLPTCSFQQYSVKQSHSSSVFVNKRR